jgi:hypothetical protein
LLRGLALGSVLLAATACRREGAARAHVPRRWDTSQATFRVPGAAIIAVAAPRYWENGIESDYLRSFMDEFDAAADSLEQAGYRVGVSFRDSIHVVREADSFDLLPARLGEQSGYYFIAPGREPHFVPGSRKASTLLIVVRHWFAAPRPGVPAPVAPTVLFPLDSFPALAPAARQALERRGCRVPQSPYAESKPNNVVRGQFTRPGQTDWAALCAVGDRMIVVVMWGAVAACPDTISQTAATVSDEHGLGVVDSAYIEQHEQWYGGGRAFPISHEGIDFGYEDKASMVWYCHEGVWWELPGAD